MLRTGRCVIGVLLGTHILISGCAASQKAMFTPPADRGEALSDESTVLFDEARERYEREKIGPVGEGSLVALDGVAARVEKGLGLVATPGVDERVLLARVYLDMIEALEAPAQREEYADKVVQLGTEIQRDQPERVEGPYFQALGMARRLDASRELSAIKPMMAMAQAAVNIEPSYDSAGALSLMGKIYLEAPPWPASVGDEDEAVEMLTRAVSLAPTPLNRLFLGEALYHAEEPDAAKKELRLAYQEGTSTGMPARWLKECEDYLRRVGEEP